MSLLSPLTKLGKDSTYNHLMGLLFSPDALDGLPREIAPHAKAKINWLWMHRIAIQHTPLRENLSGCYKRTVAKKYRIIYTFDADQDEMVIQRVGHRDLIYKRPV